MKKYNKLVVNILLFIGSIFIFFLLAEGVTRLVVPGSVKMLLMREYDVRLGYRLVPNYEVRHKTPDFDTLIRINSEGLRDYEHPREKYPEVFRILVLGDSFAFGSGVSMEESYPKLLEAMLNQNLAEKGQKYEVINAGIDGYGTEQEYLFLEELGNRYKPDLVIVGLFANDIRDVMDGIPTKKLRTNLKNNFYFLSYLRGLEILSRKTFAKDSEKILLENYQDQYTSEFANALRKTKEYLLKIRDFSNSIDARTLIVITPLCLEIDRWEWEERGFRRLYSDEFFNKNMTKFSENFTEFGKMNEIPTLPLLPTFRNNSRVTPLYFNRDIHWTKEGHRLAAESIYNFLKEKGLYIRDRGKAE